MTHHNPENVPQSAEAKRCCEQVRDSGPWPRFHQCRSKATVGREGKWYCKTHDPVAVKEKAQARDAKDREKYNLRRFAHSCVVACAGMADPVADLAALRDAVKAAYEALELIAGAHPTARRLNYAECMDTAAETLQLLQPHV